MRRFIACVLACCLLLACTAAIAAPAQELKQAELTLQASPSPPTDGDRWKPIALPDHWHNTRPDVYGEGWYRFKFDYNVSTHLQAVYLSRVSMNAEVFVNGNRIGDGGNFSEPIGRNWNRPLLFLIPPSLLHQGENLLHIRLLAPRNSQAVLLPPQVGDEPALRPLYDHAYFIRITLNQTASILITGISILMLNLWWRRRQDTAYGLFGMAALVWALLSSNLYITQAPLPTMQWELLISASFQIVATLLLISLLRFTHTDWRGLRKLLWIQMILAPLTMVIAPSGHFLELTVFWHFIAILATAATLVHLARVAWLQHHHDARLLLYAVGLVLLLAAHDWLMHSKFSWLPQAYWSSQELFLLHFAAPILFMVMAWIMTARYVRVLNEFESLNLELEARVATKHRELEENFSRIQSMHKEQTMLEERERIYQDLHDDVGAKLLSLVYRSDNPDNADLARSALQDLRDVVSRTAAEQFNLDETLADWRIECEQRLREADLVLHWHVDEGMGNFRLTQPQVLDLGRILREAVSNVIRHASAQKVDIQFRLEVSHMILEIADNGVGIDPLTISPRGRGMANMQNRAYRLGADFSTLARQPRGLALRLALPLTRLEDASPADSESIGI